MFLFRPRRWWEQPPPASGSCDVVYELAESSVLWSCAPLPGEGDAGWMGFICFCWLFVRAAPLCLEHCQHPMREESVGSFTLHCWSTWWWLYSESYFIFCIYSVSSFKTFLSWCLCSSWAKSACLSVVKCDKNIFSDTFQISFASWKFLTS